MSTAMFGANAHTADAATKNANANLKRAQCSDAYRNDSAQHGECGDDDGVPRQSPRQRSKAGAEVFFDEWNCQVGAGHGKRQGGHAEHGSGETNNGQAWHSSFCCAPRHGISFTGSSAICSGRERSRLNKQWGNVQTSRSS